MLLPLPLQIVIAMQGSSYQDNTHSDGEDEVDDDIPLSRLFQLGLASGGVPEEYTAVDDNLVTSAKMTNDDIVEDRIATTKVITKKKNHHHDHLRLPFSQHWTQFHLI